MTEEQTLNIKQRIIGAIVLVSLGVIFIPMLLNGGPELKQTITESNIPDIPAQMEKKLPAVPTPKAMPEAQPVNAYPVENRKEKTVAESAPVKNASSGETVTQKPKQFKTASQPASNKINEAYTLQIASFSQKSNAFALRDKLRKARYKAYIESIDTDKGKIYRLRVGPYLKYRQISSIKSRIEKDFKLSKTVIVKYKT